MKRMLLKDLEPILNQSSDKNYSIRLGVEVTNVSDFSWPVGLTFKLVGLGKDVIAVHNLKKVVGPGEASTIIWEFTNSQPLEEAMENDSEALFRVLKLLDEGLSSDDGFKLKVKCSFPEKKLRFISSK